MKSKVENCSHLNAAIHKCTHSLRALLRHNPSMEKQVIMIKRKQHASPTGRSLKD